MIAHPNWRDARAVDRARLENECGVLPHRGFESLSLRFSPVASTPHHLVPYQGFLFS